MPTRMEVDRARREYIQQGFNKGVSQPRSSRIQYRKLRGVTDSQEERTASTKRQKIIIKKKSQEEELSSPECQGIIPTQVNRAKKRLPAQQVSFKEPSFLPTAAWLGL